MSSEAVPPPAPPGVSGVLLLALETWCCVLALGDEAPLGTRVTLRVVLGSEADALVVLEADFVRLEGAVGVGSHGERVALLPPDLRVVQVVQRAGEGARAISVLRDLCRLSEVAHNADRRQILVVELAL